MTTPRIGLALSGGGYRATAFGLGCLRAIHDLGLLSQIRVVSGISGGSLLAAMWAYGPASFADFDDTVTALLRQDLQRELLVRALRPDRLLRGAASTAQMLTPLRHHRQRTFTRTEILADALRTREFGTRTLDEVTHQGLQTVLSATDLITTNAVRFGSSRSSCSAYGQILDPVPVADAVAASAAYPLLLPSLNRTYKFRDSEGHDAVAAVAMTDGGVYDNLGLAPLLPGRSTTFTSHVYDLDYIIAVDAGRGRTTKNAAAFLPGRLMRSFDITYSRTQDGSRSQLHAAAEHGRLKGFVHAYLAMTDSKLPSPMADLVPRSVAVDYPTNFAAMPETHEYSLTTRGEQLTRLLLAHYCPELSS